MNEDRMRDDVLLTSQSIGAVTVKTRFCDCRTVTGRRDQLQASESTMSRGHRQWLLNGL